MDGQIEVVINIKTSVQDKLIFQEKQKFTQWWLWLLLGGIAIIPAYGIYKQLIMGLPFGSKPMSNVSLLLVALFIVALLSLFWLMELRTEISSREIRMQFYPFIKKSFVVDDIASAEVINYGFVGGWGIRIGTKYGTVYNVRGKHGLFICLKSGKKYVIGTQEPEAMAKAIKSVGLGK